ncbi:hypothetical protein M2360_005292 [Rhizobium sp. SG_E_25_P2]|uniref:hypothetical protein n=1 Tax=Rhizobium sp. SG_E_25_P2 TaxID=2879942 RepID=UPI00247644A9|nr:hypothetical protein [Rhizobium sp. SG_E_25_P2]MDH6269860.1 hypothetical protein [Rhizobium sp. SG_E_25_P2]
MAITVLTANSTTAVSLTRSSDTLVVAAGISLITSFDAVELAGAFVGRNVLIDGRIVSGGDDGVSLGSFDEFTFDPIFSSGDDIMISAGGGILAADNGVIGNANVLKLTNAGAITGAGGVNVAGTGNTVVNSGVITGASFGVALFGDEGAVANSGEIASGGVAVQLSGAGLSLNNSGVIAVDSGVAAQISGETDAIARIVNSGTIQGSITETLGNATMINTGVITGDVDLGAGNDTLKLLAGVVGGDATTGAGDDFIFMGAVDIEVSGGEGTDTLSVIRNTALGLDIENLTLRGGDALKGVGNSAANLITGNRGDNTLKGLAGADTLNGGRGDDLLIGGSAKDGARDTFIFSLDCGADRIRGFQISGTGDDRIDLSDFAENEAFDSFVDLNTNSMRQSGKNVIIDLPGDDQVTIENVKLADFKASDFIF